jgi:Ni,Fe-hydrogenase III component G
MPDEAAIQSELTSKFPFLADRIRLQRERRLWADVPAEKFLEVFEYAHRHMGFTILVTITGHDFGQSLAAMYHLARESGVMLNVTVSVPRETPVLPTVSGFFPAADAYERELIDLLGMKVEGLPPGNRYPLPDDWPQGEYPLRKDWKPRAAAAE